VPGLDGPSDAGRDPHDHANVEGDRGAILASPSSADFLDDCLNYRRIHSKPAA